MISGKILIKNVEMPPVSDREIKRYAGIKGDTHEFDGLIALALEKCSDMLRNTVVYRIEPLSVIGDDVSVGPLELRSQRLAANLSGASAAVIFCATVGIEVDRLIAKYSRVRSDLAHMISSVGVERIEALCDGFERELLKEIGEDRFILCKRFSPGYGDLSIEYQKKIFDALAPGKYIGLTLNESLLMSPSKSVSAIIGIREKKNDVS